MVSFSFHKHEQEKYSPSLKFALSLSLSLSLFLSLSHADKITQLKHPKSKQVDENKAVTCTKPCVIEHGTVTG